MSLIRGVGIAAAAGLAVYMILVVYCYAMLRTGSRRYPKIRQAFLAANREHDGLLKRFHTARAHPLVCFARETSQLGPYERPAMDLVRTLDRCWAYLAQDSKLCQGFGGKPAVPEALDLLSLLALQYLPQALAYRALGHSLAARQASLASAQAQLEQFDARKEEARQVRSKVLAQLGDLEQKCVQAQQEVAVEVQEHTPQGLEGLVSGLQENRDTLAGTAARLAQSVPQDWQAVVDADRVRTAQATQLQDVRRELGKVIALREAKRQALAQVAQELAELAQDLAAPALRGVSAHQDDIRAQAADWQAQLGALQRVPGSPQSYNQGIRRARALLQEVGQARNELHARRQLVGDAERAVSVAHGRVETIKKQVFVYPECEFEETEMTLDRSETLLLVAGQRLNSGGSGIAERVTQSVREIGLELDRVESRFAVSRQRLERLRNGLRPADLQELIQEIDSLQRQPGFEIAPSGAGGPRREEAETSLRALLQTAKYPEPELGALVQCSDLVRTYVDQQLAALTERAREQHKELDSTLQRVRGYANGWHWTYRDRDWSRVDFQHRNHQRLLGRLEGEKSLAQKAELLKQLVEQIPAVGKAASELEENGRALCTGRNREQERLQKLQDLADAFAAGRRRDRGQRGLDEARAHLRRAVQASSQVDAARALEEMSRALDQVEKLFA